MGSHLIHTRLITRLYITGAEVHISFISEIQSNLSGSHLCALIPLTYNTDNNYLRNINPTSSAANCNLLEWQKLMPMWMLRAQEPQATAPEMPPQP